MSSSTATRRNPNIKHRKFIKSYVEHGNITQATIDAGYNVSTRESAAQLGSKILKIDKVQRDLQKSLEKAGLTDDFMTESLQKIANAGTSDKALSKATPDQALKALDMTAKLSNAYPEKTVNIAKSEIKYKIKGRTPDEVGKELTALFSKFQKLTS